MDHTVLHSPNRKSSTLSLMIVAGEASGDRHGASLAQALTRLNPEIAFEMFGSGGDEMRAAGVETLVDAREVGIIGVPEIARAIGKLYRAYRALLDAARSRRPAAIVLIDWPDFNMKLARKLHRDGFKIIYYISPQVWAWRRYRVRAIRRDVDRMLVILPFEEEFYKDAGVEVEYVGHPLAGIVGATSTREEFCARFGLDPTRAILSLLPGSREKEIHYHLPVMLDAALRLQTADCGLRIAESRTYGSDSRSGNAPVPDSQSQISNLKSEIPTPQSAHLQFVIPLASTVTRAQVESITNKFEAIRSHHQLLGARTIERDTYNALAHSDFAIVASGTATVEAALCGTPMVIIYRGSEINWRLIRPLIHLNTFGMVNLIAGSSIVPELIQHDATGERIATEVSAILSDRDRLSRMKKDLARVRELLSAGGGSAAETAAMAVMNVIVNE
ncbi:MAG TPA: lipid-A-disaccharide synthase [Blastocatellia bacterium]|nr:lipid-A-disaccharide synthase [Blastocatellia bacterium]